MLQAAFLQQDHELVGLHRQPEATRIAVDPLAGKRMPAIAIRLV
jgi:hypothetical protein